MNEKSFTIGDMMVFLKEKLESAFIEDSGFETLCLMTHFTKMSRIEIIICKDKMLDPTVSEQIKAACERRVKGEPLQYILGEWEFLGMKFFVGYGVLIPRPETELLAEIAIKKIKEKNENLTIFDLCAGSGCLGISLAEFCSNAHVYMIEKSEAAIEYAKKNLRYHETENAEIIKGDILKGFSSFDLPQPDIIISNPPYIETGDLEFLQREVLREPVMALDGGADGLIFYEAISEKWMPFLKKDGYIAVECGESQAYDIEGIFRKNGDVTTDILSDYNGINRIVTAILHNKYS